MFGLTNNKQFRNVEIDALSLPDSAIEVLKSKKLNNLLIGELLSHEDFQQLLIAIEVYVDRKVLPQMTAMNTMLKFAENAIKTNYAVADNDEIIAFLQEAIVEEDEYLLYRIANRFTSVLQDIFEAHKKDAKADEQLDIVKDIKEQYDLYKSEKDDLATGRSHMAFWAKQLGLDTKKLTDEEILVLGKALGKSSKMKRVKNRKM